ncbi:MAG TPA: aspartate aminotransferase family protein [Gaiellales bacterium]|nr:aspartate aminotransferase family protein [Gaiellales bacterium]
MTVRPSEAVGSHGSESTTGALWHPFSDMGGRSAPIEMVRGEGVWLWDVDGNRYLDGSSSLWYANVGHGRPEIAQAISDQLASLETFHIFGDFTNRPAVELADRLASLAPMPDPKVFLTSGGGDSIETAVKLARLYHAVRGEPSRQFVISRVQGYHGTHGIGTSILGMPFTEGFGELVHHTARVPWDSAEALEAEITRLGSDQVAAFVFEPVVGSGGVLVPPEGYLEDVVRICRAHGVLAIADAVICGFGRLGSWFGVERWGIEPDMIAFAKGVTSGYLPLGGVIASAEVAEPFFGEPGRMFAHGATYSGHATCCAAALANIDLLKQDDLVHRAAAIERPFHERLSSLESHPLVDTVRGGTGLMAAIVLDGDAIEERPALAGDFWRAARRHGVLTRSLSYGAAVAPPLIIDDAEQDMIASCLGAALDEVQRSRR